MQDDDEQGTYVIEEDQHSLENQEDSSNQPRQHHQEDLKDIQESEKGSAANNESKMASIVILYWDKNNGRLRVK